MHSVATCGLMLWLACSATYAMSQGTGRTAEATANAPRSIVEAKFAAANRHDVEAVVAFYARDARLEASDLCATRHGLDEVRRTYSDIFAFAPEIRADVKEIIVEGDRVAAQVLLQSDAPGVIFKLQLMNFFTVKSGKIVRDEGVFDNGGRACKR